jgi:hypothetical protein
MKKIYFSIVLVFIVNIVSAQYTISAKIKDRTTTEPLAFCSIALLSQGEKGKFAVSDKDGYFEMPVKGGHYQLVIRYVGYTPDTLTVKVADKNVYLGVIKLESANKELQGVEVKASTKHTDIDKDEVLMTSKMRTGASTAREVLEKVNGVSYDRYKDAIKVDNNTNIIILVNGLQKNQEYVKNLDPERIAKIEVIRDPSGRYGIEGYSAILNIVLKQNYVGQELFVSSNNIFDTKAPKSSLIMPIQGYSLGYNYSRKNLNLYSQFNMSKNTFGLKHTEHISYDGGLVMDYLSPDSGRNMLAQEEMYSLTLGGDYMLNSKNIFSAEINASYSPETPTSFYYIHNFTKDTLLASLPYSSFQNSESKTASASLFYIGNYSDSKSLKVDLTYGMNESKRNSNFGYQDSDMVFNSQKTDVNYVNTNVEWSQNLGDRFSWQLGYGGKWKESHNDNLANGQQSSFLVTELRNKAFSYGIWKLRKDVKLKFGLGVENSYLRQSNNRRNFWIFKPHIDLFYKPSEYINIKLKYRVDADYPTIGQSDSTEIHMDMFTSQKGNPFLTPSTIHKLSLKINAMMGLVTVEPYIHYSDNYIAPVGKLRSDGIFVNTYGNLGIYQNQGVEINLTIPIGKTIVWQNSVDFYHSSMSYESINNNLSDWSGESQLMYIRQDWDMVAGFMYQRANNRYISLQGYSNQQNDWWGIMVQKTFFKNKFNVMAMMFLPIDFGADYTQNTYLQTPAYTATTLNDISLLKHLFIIQLSYRFHKGKSISKVEKNVDRETIEKKGGLF